MPSTLSQVSGGCWSYRNLDNCVSRLLTTARTEFIGKYNHVNQSLKAKQDPIRLFAVQTGMSFLPGDLAPGSPGMDAVKELTKACPELWGK
jgi:hypothetical protein